MLALAYLNKAAKTAPGLSENLVVDWAPPADACVARMAGPSVKWSQPLARVGAGIASVVLLALMITTEWDAGSQMPTTGATVSPRHMPPATVSPRKRKDDAAVAFSVAAGRMMQETVAYKADRFEARQIRRQIRQLTQDVGSGSGDLCSCDSGSGSGALVGDSGSGSGSGDSGSVLGDSGSGSGDLCPCDSGSGSGVLEGDFESGSGSGSGDVGSGPCTGASCAEPEPPSPSPPPTLPPPPSSPPPSPPPSPSSPPQYVEQRRVPTPTADTQSTILAENNGCSGLLCDTGPSTARIKRVVLEEDGPAYYLAHFSVVFDQELFVYGSKYDNDTLRSISDLPLQSTTRRDGRHAGETPPFLQPINLAMGGAYELNCQNSAAEGFPVMSGTEGEESEAGEAGEAGEGATYLKRMTTMPPLKMYTVPDCNTEEGCMIVLGNGDEEQVLSLSYASKGACYGLADFSVCPAQADILPHAFATANGYEDATFQPARSSFCLGADCVEADLTSGSGHILTHTLTPTPKLALTLIILTLSNPNQERATFGPTGT